jgi:putrescine---pyruvate transaminase
MTRFWHGFAAMGSVPGDELVFVRGEGCVLEDRDGARYLDAVAGLGYCNAGYGRREIADAMHAQVLRLSGCTHFERYASDRALALSERLAALAPIDDAVVFLTSGGSDAIDTAAKLARRYWAEVGRPEKTAIISREGSFHGAHAYGTSIGGIAANAEGLGALVREVRTVPKHDADALERAIEEIGPDRVAALVAEPVISAGVHPPQEGYWAAVQEICRRHDVLLVLDEVMTGFGRLGSWFGAGRYGIVADMIVFAKGVTSGYFPLGGVIVGPRVAEPFWQPGTTAVFRHGYTYSGHPVGCAAAEENLDLLAREDLPARGAALASELARTLAGLTALPHVAEVRSVGLFAAVQLEPALVAADPALPVRLVRRCLDHGLLTRTLNGYALQVTPPLTITRAQIEQVRDAIARACSEEESA